MSTKYKFIAVSASQVLTGSIVIGSFLLWANEPWSYEALVLASGVIMIWAGFDDAAIDKRRMSATWLKVLCLISDFVTMTVVVYGIYWLATGRIVVAAVTLLLAVNMWLTSLYAESLKEEKEKLS